MATPTPSTTGPGSTSFAVWIATFVAGLGSAAEGVLTHGTSAHTAVYGAGGVLLTLGSTLGKLVHDKGLHVATIAAAGSDIAAQLPQLKTDIATAVDFAENKVPGVETALDSVKTRVVALENKVAPAASTDVAAVTSIVHQVLAAALGSVPAPSVNMQTPPGPGVVDGTVAA